jgi:LacI family transcriptional regulator
MTGIRAALAEAGVSPRSLHVVAGDGTTAAGARAAVRILLQAPDVTAIATYNDLTAIGVVRGLYEAGRSVPGDLSVIGFDGIAEAGWMQPPLTTVSQESARMGRLAAEHLIRLLAGSSTGVVEDPVRLPMTLIPRESTARPRSMRGA